MFNHGSEDRQKRARRVKKIGFSAVLCLLLYASLELIALTTLWLTEPSSLSFNRILRDQNDYALTEPIGSTNCIHPYFGWVHNPSAAETLTVQDHIFPVNQHGFLGGANPIQKHTPSRLVIAIVGGSVAQHIALLGEEILKKELEPLHKEIIIVDLAAAGYKQPQQLLVLNYMMALGAEYDWVVNLDGYNEIALHPGENGLQDVFIAYPQDWYVRMRNEADAVFAPILWERWNNVITRHNWAHFFSTLPRAVRCSPTLALTWRLRHNWLTKKILNHERWIFEFRQKGGRRFVEVGPPNPYTNEEEMYHRLVELWSKCSSQLHRVCSSQGIRYLHCLQPNQHHKGSKPMGQQEASVASLKTNYGLAAEKGYPMLISEAERMHQKGIPILDLTMIFKAHPEPLYTDWFCHFNQSGINIVAKRIAEEILRVETAH